MPNKTQEYLNLAQQTAKELTRYWENWSDYLTTASRLYKYSFADQLMIYAQRPDATACADFDIWNNRMNRYVRRGSKGIALLDESSGFPRLHYVFDVSDTGVRRNSRDPEVWQYNDDLKQPVSEMLAAIYGISGERVSQQLADVAGKLVADYWDNNGGDIRATVDGSLLMDYDEAGVEMQFKSAAAMSVTYTLLERCGFEPAGWFDKDDFQAIYNFSTPDSVYALGAAVSDMSREVLRNIERTVKTTIRRRNNERSQHEYTSVKGARQKRFIRFKTLGAGYSEDELQAVIAGKTEHRPRQTQPFQEPPFQLLVDIQAKLYEGKSEGYARWAKKYNLKEMSKTLIFLQEHKIGSADELNERTAAATEKYHQLGDSIKAAETRMAEIAVLKTHIVNYAKTHPVYDAYRKAGYSKKFLDTHREEITLHKVAKAAFDETGLKKLPKVKALNAEYSDLLTQKKAAYPDYRKAREEMQELVKAQKNIELFFAEEKDAQEKQQTR